MKKVLILTIIFVTSAMSMYLSIKVFRLTKELTLLKKESAESKRALEQNRLYIISIQKQTQEQLKKNVSELQLQQKIASPSVYIEPGIHISAIESVQSKDVKSIAFWVNGPDKAMYDAMDIGLTFSNIKEVPVCTTGDAFSQYPLIDKNEKYLTITGIADISLGKITTGGINKLFVTCLFEKKDSNQNVIVELNPLKTHIYFLGKPVLDLENSFTKSIW